jgi:hypothetical protein
MTKTYQRILWLNDLSGIVETTTISDYTTALGQRGLTKEEVTRYRRMIIDRPMFWTEYNPNP